MPDSFTLPCISAATLVRCQCQDVLIVDVRKPAALRASGVMLGPAIWIDPFSLGFASPILRRRRSLVFYCAHGHEVSQFAVALALVAGRPAVYVTGGFEALVAAGAKLCVVEGDVKT